MLRKWFCLFLCIFLIAGSQARAMNRDELRAAWQSVSAARTDASPYMIKPDISAFAAGELTENAQQEALSVLNFLRSVAGVDAVQLNNLYTLRAQNGALLLAVNDQLDHNAPRPAGMDDQQYESAHMGTSMGNIAKFNWMRPEILVDGVTYFARDDGDINLSSLGHRRWLLNPCMAETGFGLANSQSGMSYVAMYAVDAGNAGAQWDYIAWPSSESFPVEMMRASLPWSVSLNEEIFDLSASRPQVYLKEETCGAEFHFDICRGEGDGFCTLSREQYGSGSCIIFRPDLAEKGIAEYVQNQVWSVHISGLKNADGSDSEITYRCEMASLNAQDVANIELSQLEASLSAGETLQLHANVIPAYADDLSIIWGSDDPMVASVDARGLVTAVGAGECRITAMSANGRRDICTITVE